MTALEAYELTTKGGGTDCARVIAACEAFAFLRLKFDIEKNARSPVDQDIAADNSAVRVVVVRAQENWAIARECWKLVLNQKVN